MPTSRRTQYARLAASYGRVFLAAAIAVWAAEGGTPGVRQMVAAGVAAVLPPLMRWANPADPAFGRGTAG
jgi:hypothetical protein